MTSTHKPLSTEDATAANTGEPSEDVRAWQAQKIKIGLRAADEGRFASSEAVKAVIQKFIRNG